MTLLVGLPVDVFRHMYLDIMTVTLKADSTVEVIRT